MDTEATLSGERLNSEPIIFRGCGSSELLLLVIAGLIAIFPITVGIMAFLGYAMMGVGVSAVLLVIAVVAGATWFQRAKRGQPHGHYQQVFALWLEDAGLRRTQVIRNEGHWDVGRSLHGRLPSRSE